MKLTSMSFGINDSEAMHNPNFISYIMYILFTYKCGIKSIHIDKDDSFTYIERFDRKANDVILQVIHDKSDGIWKQTVHCQSVKLS